MKLLFLANVIALCTWPVHSQQKEPLDLDTKIRPAGIEDGTLLKRVDPIYPREAKKQHLQGDVILSAVIDREGNIKDIKVVSGDPVLADSAVKAVKQWKYRPYRLEGRPVEVKTMITVLFHR